MVETLTCPHCQAKLQSSKTISLPETTVATCKTCSNKFTLKDARRTDLQAAWPESPPPRPKASPAVAVSAPTPGGGSMSVATSDVPHRQTIATQVVVNHPEQNSLGTAAFVTSIVAIVSLGCLSPVSLILSIIAMQKKPRGMAVTGVILSLIAMLPMLLFGGSVLAMLGLVSQASVAVQQAEKNAEANRNSLSQKIIISNVTHHTDRINEFRQEHAIKFAVKNTLPVAISALHIEFEFRQPGRTVPVAKGGISSEIAGGIEPGETKMLDWIPGFGAQDLRQDLPEGLECITRIQSAKDAKGEYITVN